MRACNRSTLLRLYRVPGWAPVIEGELTQLRVDRRGSTDPLRAADAELARLPSEQPSSATTERFARVALRAQRHGLDLGSPLRTWFARPLVDAHLAGWRADFAAAVDCDVDFSPDPLLAAVVRRALGPNLWVPSVAAAQLNGAVDAAMLALRQHVTPNQPRGLRHMAHKHAMDQFAALQEHSPVDAYTMCVNSKVLVYEYQLGYIQSVVNGQPEMRDWFTDARWRALLSSARGLRLMLSLEHLNSIVTMWRAMLPDLQLLADV